MVPSALRKWFVVHFVVDLAFALPLFIAPVETLKLFGWGTIDPFATRMVAAALFGIGIQSYLGRNEDLAAFRAMLSLKIIWSLACVVGLAVSLAQSGGAPAFGWVILAIFALFSFVWSYYRWRLRRAADTVSTVGSTAG